MIVHSVVSEWWILDLVPGRSIVADLVVGGHDVWLLYWQEPAPGDAALDLRAYARAVADAEAVVRHTAGGADVHLVGYCLGATVTLLRAAVGPDPAPASLVLIAPVVDTHADRHAGMGRVVGHPWLHPSLVLDENGLAPAALVREGFHVVRPMALRTVFGRHQRAGRQFYGAMARWAWEQRALGGGVLLDVVDLYRDNGLATGRLGDLGRVRCPVLVIVSERDHLVPPACSLALRLLLPGEPAVQSCRGGHVSMLVGSGAADVLQPALRDWLNGGWRESTRPTVSR